MRDGRRSLLVTSEFPPDLWGGVGRYSYELWRASGRRRSFDVLVVPTYVDARRLGTQRMKAAPTGGVGRVVVRRERGFSRALGAPSLSLEAYMNESARLVEGCIAKLRPRYDLLYVQDFYTVGIARELWRRGTASRVVAACHLPLSARFSYFDKSLADTVQQQLEAALLRVADRVVVPSGFARRGIQQIYNVDPGKLVVIPLGVDPPACLVDRFPASGRALRVGSVMRMTDQKGLPYYPRVLAATRARRVRIEFQAVGSGPRMEDFLRIMDPLRHEVRFRHDTFLDPGKDLFSRMGSWHVYLGLSAHETFGLTVLEAMATGAVPVCFDVGSLGELVEDGRSGFLCPPGDWPAIVDRLRTLAVDGSLLRRMSETARQRASEFTWSLHMDRLEDWVFRP